jgi:MarR family transcriptional regulator, transcriptional regulator for hemolysin
MAQVQPTHELDAPPWLRVETTLMAVARLVREAYDARFAALELNLTQASIIAYVADFGPVIQTRIADHLGNGRAATGASIDRLQERGLLERQPDPVDRRVWQISLTGAGREIAGRISDVDGALRTELRDGITKPERQALNDVLVRLGSNLHRAIDATDTPL